MIYLAHQFWMTLFCDIEFKFGLLIFFLSYLAVCYQGEPRVEFHFHRGLLLYGLHFITDIEFLYCLHFITFIFLEVKNWQVCSSKIQYCCFTVISLDYFRKISINHWLKDLKLALVLTKNEALVHDIKPRRVQLLHIKAM